MTNHPNRGRKYTAHVAHWVNNGLGWERSAEDQNSSEAFEDLTKPQIDNLAAERDLPSTSITVYDDWGVVLAMADRGVAKVSWF